MIGLRSLSRIGVTDELPSREVRHVVFLNVVVFLIFFIGIQNILLAAAFLPGTRLSMIFMVTQVICIGLTLFLNQRGKYLLARIWFSLCAALFLTIHTILLGTGSRFQFFLAVCVFVMFYLFPLKEKYWMYFFIGVFSIFFVATEFLVGERALIGDISEQFLMMETYFNTTGVLFCALSMGGVGYLTIKTAEENLFRENERSESLLRNILPVPIAERLKSTPGSIAESYSDATILFVDIVGFTKLSESIAPEALIDLLNSVFSEIDDLTDKYDLEKIKTIGDAYMVVSGAPKRRVDHAEAMAAMSLDMKEKLAKLNWPGQRALDFRIGIHSGPVIAGVIGKKKFSYDLWGDSVNTAARMESHGVSGEIQVSARVQAVLKDKFLFVERGAVDLKGKGEVFTYLLKGRLAA